MTIVAWDGTTLAADTQADASGVRASVTKIFRLTDGSLFAGSGSLDQVLEMRNWVDKGASAEDFPSTQRDKDDWQPCINITKNGVYRYERTPFPIKFNCAYFTEGSGSYFATAALHLGKNAVEAVQVAIDLCPSCGGSIDTLTLS